MSESRSKYTQIRSCLKVVWEPPKHLFPENYKGVLVPLVGVKNYRYISPFCVLEEALRK